MGAAPGGTSTATLALHAPNAADQPATNPLAHQLAWRRVKAGDPERSFLVRKLDGPGLGEGDPMPSTRETVSGPSRQLLVRWIADGATP